MQASPSSAEVANASRATFATRARVLAVLRPKNTEQVQDCLRIANETATPVYPTSGGRNWGYGSRVPVQDSALLDLRRLDRIVAFDEELAYVVLEPGVTFEKLHAFLRERRSRLAPLTVGSSSRASVVANILERGFGRGGYADRMANVCALDVVLPSGELLRTGFTGRSAFVHRYGVGPALDGLFSQSNLGVVTRMAVWLQPSPPLQDVMRFGVNTDRDLARALTAIQQLRLRGVLRDSCAISSRERVIARVQQYPWGAAKGRTPLPRAVLNAAASAGVATWMGWATTGYLSREHRRAVQKLIRDVLDPVVDDLAFVPIDPQQTDQSSDSSLPYWRKRTRKPSGPPNETADPDRDGCGVIMFAPVIPFDGREIAASSRLMAKTMRAHGFDPIVQIQCLFERSVILNAMILFDRDVAGEDEAALACYRALGELFEAAGYAPYRKTILAKRGGDEDGGADQSALGKIKRALDPNDVLAPTSSSQSIHPPNEATKRRAP